MNAFGLTRLALVRGLTVLFCFGACQVLTLNHFLYAVLKERYALYQAAFYVATFMASLTVAPPWRLHRSKWRIVLGMCCVGYLSSALTFCVEPIMLGRVWPALSTRGGALFYKEVFVAPLFAAGWLFGLMIGAAIVTAERKLIIRTHLTSDICGATPASNK